MGISAFLERLRAKKEKYNAYAEEQRMVQKFEEKSKSANERELERFMKEEREDSIKKELEEFRKHKQKQAHYGNQIVKVKNMFAAEHNKKSILSQRNLFLNNDNLFAGKDRSYIR